MRNGTEHIPDKDALLRFANSETGKSLLGRIQNCDQQQLNAAAQKASAGDIGEAMQILQALLATSTDDDTPEGSNGKRY